MSHKKPQYITTEGFVRSSVNPLKDARAQLKKLREKKESEKKEKEITALELSKIKPLKSFKSAGLGTENANPLVRKKISPEAAKMIAAAISGMLKR